jgi:hypothetical protein
LFSTVQNWWAFPFETQIGRLQRIPTNHKSGKPSQEVEFCGLLTHDT